VQDHIVTYEKKKILKFFALCIRNGNFIWNLMKKRPSDFRVNFDVKEFSVTVGLSIYPGSIFPPKQKKLYIAQ